MTAAPGGAEPPPLTAPVARGWRSRLSVRPGLHRLRGSGFAILQVVIATTGAFTFCFYVLGHQVPLVAGIVALTSLGLARDTRPLRVAETVIAMILGILVAELILLTAGSGWWQFALALGVTLVLARFIAPQPGFAIPAGIQSMLVITLPAASPFERLIDGVVGGAVALLVTALIPRSTRSVELGEGHALFDAFDDAIRSLVLALRFGSPEHAARGLEKARSLEPRVTAWRSSLDAAAGIARVSPFLWRQRGEIARHARALAAMDLAIRNLRVVGRRTSYLCDDGQPRAVAADTLEELQRGARLVADAVDDIAAEPVAREAILAVARRLDPVAMLPDAALGERNLVGAYRPLSVDLLAAAGMDRDEVRRIMPRA